MVGTFWSDLCPNYAQHATHQKGETVQFDVASICLLIMKCVTF